MSKRYGVSISYYGGASWALAALERELGHAGIPTMQIRGCAYPEMARAEQVRQARLAGIETLVFVDAHVEASVRGLEELVAVAEQHGMATLGEPDAPGSLECAAVHRDVIEAMVRQEERTYGNSAVDTLWSGEKVPAAPLASPWQRNGAPLVPGAYFTDSEAFVYRARRAGAVVVQHWPETVRAYRKFMRSRSSNTDRAPNGREVGSQFALCIPSFASLDLDQQNAVFQLETAGMTILGLHDCPWIDQARSWLTEQALELGKGVFFLDHDIIFHPNDVLRLCEQALERQAVVAGAYCMRRSGKNIIGSFDVPPGPRVFFEGGETLPAYYSGLGFAAIPKDVLDAIELPLLTSDALAMGGLGASCAIRPWYALDCSTGFYAGEDVSFCNRVHDLAVELQSKGEGGFEPEWKMSHSGRPARVFIDSRVRIFHRGSYDYGIEDAGIVVPRIASLSAVMTASRQEAAAVLVNALHLPVEVQLDTREFPAP